ncbi:MAG: hypothetical protein QHC90_23445 [Shinella sp.]|nr:hypothetical protein [Shinella sp.]
MARYYRVSRSEIRKENDIVVVVVPAEDGPLAYLGDPTLRLGNDLKPLAQALALAERMIAADLNPRHLVVIDEDGVWDERAGELVPHPERGHPAGTSAGSNGSRRRQ